jgi:GDSL-like Lipase/Acylhydrolase family
VEAYGVRRTLVLLGDSILDNAPYTASAPDTTQHLRQQLGSDWTVERLARDGAVMSDVRFQLAQLGDRVDCIVLSVGGNDALEHVDLLERRASSAARLFGALADIADQFSTAYLQVANAVAARTPRLVLCTIYEPPLLDQITARLARVPLGVLNDRIVQVASRLGLEVLDLRSVCTETCDFVQQIEPSARGAAKIATAIAALLRGTRELSTARVIAHPGGDAL